MTDNFLSVCVCVCVSPEISRQRFHCLQVYCSSLKCFLVGFTDDYWRVKLTEIPGEEGSDYIKELQCKSAIPFIANVSSCNSSSG